MSIAASIVIVGTLATTDGTGPAGRSIGAGQRRKAVPLRKFGQSWPRYAVEVCKQADFVNRAGQRSCVIPDAATAPYKPR